MKLPKKEILTWENRRFHTLTLYADKTKVQGVRPAKILLSSRKC